MEGRSKVKPPRIRLRWLKKDSLFLIICLPKKHYSTSLFFLLFYCFDTLPYEREIALAMSSNKGRESIPSRKYRKHQRLNIPAAMAVRLEPRTTRVIQRARPMVTAITKATALSRGGIRDGATSAAAVR
jgi:hypothetical protein